MNEVSLVLSVAVSTWVLCIVLSKPASRFYVLDNPNHRSLHEIPKPKTGGIAIIFFILLSWVLILSSMDDKNNIHYVLIGMCILSITSYLDDRFSISQLIRLIVHVIAAVLIIISGFTLSSIDAGAPIFFGSGLVLNVLTVLIIVWVINLYNFMDGIDGLAGGMGLIGFSCLAWFGWIADNNTFMLMSGVVAASNLGFLIHNFPPAKIFMGDVGSITLGYLVAYFSLWGISSGVFEWWIPILLFSPFLLDASLTLMKRLIRGEKVWEAHKSHYYQKLVDYGWGHKKTVILEYILMVALAFSAAYLHVMDDVYITITLLVLWTIIYTIIITFIHKFNHVLE